MDGIKELAQLAEDGKFNENPYGLATGVKIIAGRAGFLINSLDIVKAIGSNNPEYEIPKSISKIGISAAGAWFGAKKGFEFVVKYKITNPYIAGLVIFAGSAIGSYYGSLWTDFAFDRLFSDGFPISEYPNTPLISISNPTVNESDQEVVFDITLSKPLEEDLELSLHTSNGTAVASEDYTPNNTTITIKAGETSYKHSVAITDDMQKEGSEYFTLTAQSINITDPNVFGYYVISSAIINNKQGINSNINFYCKVS
nr:Calx-beta domain-containing protein [Campylobacter sp. RM16188]